MPGLTSAHLQPNGFEKMRVTFAFQLFGNRVINGLHFYKEKLESSWGNIDATISFFRTVNCLIRTMTSRFTAQALRRGSNSAQIIKDFLQLLSRWEAHANGAGFLSLSTAVGLKVTLSGTLALLEYLSTQGFRHLMTSRLSQDPLENFFGIVRQSCGSNDHPTPTQFLIVVNCLSFYNLANTVSSGNADSNDPVSSLLDACDAHTAEADLDKFIESGNLSLAEAKLSRISAEHSGYVIEKSDDRLIHYMAGYVARKFIARSDCIECKNLLLQAPNERSEDSEFTGICDKGGLLYPSRVLFLTVRKLEDLFTTFFSQEKLCSNSIVDVMLLSKSQLLCGVGCSQHSDVLTASIVKFYVLTRLHFYVRGMNESREASRKKKLHAKIGRCA